jgi:hypothetical protein
MLLLGKHACVLFEYRYSRRFFATPDEVMSGFNVVVG